MADSQGVRVVLFRVGDLVCGVSVDTLREVIPSQSATRIPGAHPAVEGLVNVRGMILTVVDGHVVLDRPPSQGLESSTLILEVGGRSVGFEVDEVLDLIEIPEGALAPQDALPGADPRLVKAVGRYAGGTFVLLEPTDLLVPVIG